MRTFYIMILGIIITDSCLAQKRFTNNGKLFIVDNIGYKTPIKGFYQNQLLDDLIGLPINAVSYGGTIHYFYNKSWGVFADGQFDDYNGLEDRDAFAGATEMEKRYGTNYFFEPFKVANANGSKSLRIVLGPAYSIEKHKFTLRVGVGLGVTRFKTAVTSGYLKERNTNKNYAVTLVPDGTYKTPAPFTVQANMQLGYRWHKRWGTTIGAKYATFNSGFDYKMKRIDIYSGENIVDQSYNYNRRASDITWAIGMMFVVGAKDR